MITEVVELNREDWEKLIDDWIVGRNAERNRKILKRRLIDGVTYESLAYEFDLSVQQTKSIVSKAEAKLFRHI